MVTPTIRAREVVMHYFGLVVVPPDTADVRAYVEQAMAPHREEYIEGPEGPDGDDGTFAGHWDWWRIGGRWDGYLTDAEDCALCAKDGGHSYSKDHEHLAANVVTLPNLREDCYGQWLLKPDGEWFHKIDPHEDIGFEPFMALHEDEQEAMRNDYEKTWRKGFIEALIPFKGYHLVGCDIHS